MALIGWPFQKIQCKKCKPGNAHSFIKKGSIPKKLAYPAAKEKLLISTMAISETNITGGTMS